MTEALPAEEATLFPKTAGERLREARESQGLSLAEIAARTRVPVRQLEAVETSNFAALPSITYSVGFAKAYARAIGLDEVAIARDVRAQSGHPTPRREAEIYTVDEPTARVPTRGLAIGALVVALLLLAGIGLWYNMRGSGDGEAAAPVASTTQNAVAPASVYEPVTPPAAPTGPVVLTAADEVWMKVYTADKTLFQGTLKAGDRYEIPADAVNPMINVGRPDKLQVTVGGGAVAPLGDGRTAIKDVAVSVAALTARGTPQASASPLAAPTAPAATSPTRHEPVHRAAQRDRRTSEPAPASAPLNMAAPVTATPPPTAPAPAPTPTP